MASVLIMTKTTNEGAYYWLGMEVGSRKQGMDLKFNVEMLECARQVRWIYSISIVVRRKQVVGFCLH
jgi:hypothetical protein